MEEQTLIKNFIFDIALNIIKININNASISFNQEFANKQIDLTNTISIDFQKVQYNLLNDLLINEMISNIIKRLFNDGDIDKFILDKKHDMIIKINTLLKKTITNESILECCNNIIQSNEYVYENNIVINQEKLNNLAKDISKCIMSDTLCSNIADIIQYYLSSETILELKDDGAFNVKKSGISKFINKCKNIFDSLGVLKWPIIIFLIVTIIGGIIYILNKKVFNEKELNKKGLNKKGLALKYANVASLGKNIVRKINDNATELISDLDSFSITSIE